MANNREPTPHLERLWKAVQEYVKAEGGEVVVIGDVQVLQWPDDPALNFTLGVKCTGKKPKFADSKK